MLTQKTVEEGLSKKHSRKYKETEIPCENKEKPKLLLSTTILYVYYIGDNLCQQVAYDPAVGWL